MKGGAKVVVEKHRHEGIFVARGKEDALVTKNMVVGESVYGEKRISVDVRARPSPRFSPPPLFHAPAIFLPLPPGKIGFASPSRREPRESPYPPRLAPDR